MGAPISIDPELLQGQESWLRRLALELVGDLQLTEDVVQETWLAALERPPSVAADESGLRRWLARVLRNRVLLSRRGSARRRARELRASRAEATPDVAETVQRAELLRGLMDAVLELPPQQRDVVLLRYLDDVPPREIAKRLGLGDAAVRSRLARGLASLRSRLDSEHERGRRGWSAAFLLHFAPLGSQATLAPLIMKTQTKIVLVALLALGAVGSFELLRKDPTTRGAEPLARVAGSSDRATLPPLEETTEPTGLPEVSTGAERVPVPAQGELPAQDVPAARVSGRVRSASGAPVAGVLVRFEIREARPWTFDGASTSSTQTDREGRFELVATDPHGRVIVVDPEWVSLLDERFAGEIPERELELFVAPRRDYAGVVVDTDGQAVGGAWIHLQLDTGLLAGLRPGVKRESTPMLSATSEEDGAFVLEAVPWLEGIDSSVQRSGFETLDLELPPESRADLRLVLERPPAPAGDLHGIVVDAEGAGVPEASVFHGGEEVLSDAEGRFLIVRDESSMEVLALKRGFLPCAKTLEQGSVGELRLVLDGKPLELRVRVLDAAGEPLPRANVWTADGKPLPGQHAYRRSHYEDLLGTSGGGLRSNRDQQTDERGEALLTGLLPGIYSVHAMHPRTLELVTQEAQAGGGLTLRLEGSEAAGRVAGRVLSLSGAPIPNVTLLLGRDDAGGPDVPKTPWVLRDTPRTDQQGRFEIESLCATGAFFYMYGEGINGVRFDLTGVADLENIEIRLPLRCSFQVLLKQNPDEADSVRVLDEQGDAQRVIIEYGEVGDGATMMSTSSLVRLAEGASDVIHVDELARTLVLLDQGVEVRRVPIRLLPGEIQVVRL